MCYNKWCQDLICTTAFLFCRTCIQFLPRHSLKQIFEQNFTISKKHFFTCCTFSLWTHTFFLSQWMFIWNSEVRLWEAAPVSSCRFWRVGPVKGRPSLHSYNAGTGRAKNNIVKMSFQQGVHSLKWKQNYWYDKIIIVLKSHHTPIVSYGIIWPMVDLCFFFFYLLHN